MAAQDNHDTLTTLTVDIVSAYAANNRFPSAELSAVIGHVHDVLARISGAPASVEAEARVDAHAASPAEIRSSIRRDALVSFLNGKPYKTLKRHLTSHGLSPAAYRQRFGLPDDYPMIAEGYRNLRSQIGKATLLGEAGRQESRARQRKAA